MSHYHWGEFQTRAFHVVPSMGLIVSVVNVIVSAKTGNIRTNYTCSEKILFLVCAYDIHILYTTFICFIIDL